MPKKRLERPAATMSEDGKSFWCHACGAKHPVELPISVDEFAKKARSFVTLHKDCKSNEKETT